MTRKDSEKDAERPHYYSQFWLDIAAGRRVIGGPKPEEAEANEAEAPELAVPARKAGRNADTLREIRASAVVEPEVEEDEELEQDNTVDEADLPNIVFDDDSELATDVAVEDFNEEEPEAEDEDFFEEEEEEEDEEEWGRRGARKKAKPVRPTKAIKKPKREPRRNF